MIILSVMMAEDVSPLSGDPGACSLSYTITGLSAAELVVCSTSSVVMAVIIPTVSRYRRTKSKNENKCNSFALPDNNSAKNSCYGLPCLFGRISVKGGDKSYSVQRHVLPACWWQTLASTVCVREKKAVWRWLQMGVWDFIACHLIIYGWLNDII